MITATATRVPTSTPIRRRLAATLVALVAILLTWSVSAQPASAASPGAFNYVQCIPSNQVIYQDIEAYRSTANEYVMVQGALVNRATGAAYYSQWALGTGSTAHAAVRWYPVPKGSYNVFYRWSVWNSSRQQYVNSVWVQVTGAGLLTYGKETFPGSGMFIGGSVGSCSI